MLYLGYRERLAKSQMTSVLWCILRCKFQKLQWNQSRIPLRPNKVHPLLHKPVEIIVSHTVYLWAYKFM